MAKHDAIEKQLHRLGWKTNNIDLHGQIISAIIAFQRKWNGTSPSNAHISHAVGISPGQVCYELKLMEQKGLIKDDKGWPRTLEIVPPKAVMKEEEVKMEDVKPKTQRKRAQPFYEAAKTFAQALMDYYDQHGHSPMLRDLVKPLGYSSATGLSLLTLKMKEAGLLHHETGRKHDYALTALGRAMLFGKVNEDIHTDMPVSAERQKAPQIMEPYEAKHWSMDARVPPKVEIRRTREPTPMYMPPQRMHEPSTFTGNQNLAGIETVDLVLELQSRGFRVTR